MGNKQLHTSGVGWNRQDIGRTGFRRCDSIKLDGTTKPSNQERGTYGHAQKMRVSMTYAFGRLCGLVNMLWHESDIRRGIMVGNPSISVEVSSYMCSLRRCKVQAGEVANSAWAITSEILLKLYHHNHHPENWTVHPYHPGGQTQLGGLSQWVAFLCMLQFNEVLKIQVHNLSVHKDEPDKVVLHLPFRKTHQNGDIKPFNLWALSSSEAHLCPSKITSGNLFQKVASGDQIAEANSPMSSEQFLELFHNNLLDISIDPAPYGTHLFRRGGCQYLHIERHCTEFTNMTIVKYLISSNDDPTEPRTQFFNSNRRV
ncbi:DNA breaking-rejoining enzyme [Suillus lakei]|nr:DNA breaking-rejoining enzyme [Suillus lakei]